MSSYSFYLDATVPLPPRSERGSRNMFGMINCSIKGCEANESEWLSDPEMLSRWVILRSCRCGAYDHRDQPKSCTCPSHPESKVPISYWPNLDWWILGGVEEIVLCPDHKELVRKEIQRQHEKKVRIVPYWYRGSLQIDPRAGNGKLSA